MFKPLTIKLVLEAANKVYEKVAEDGGPPVGITVLGAEGNIIASIASDVVYNISDCYTAMIAKTAFFSQRHTIELEPGSNLGSCSPSFYTSQPGGVIIRSGPKGDIACAVAVTGRHDITKGNERLGGNHNLAIIFADSLGDGYLAISSREEYLEFLKISKTNQEQ